MLHDGGSAGTQSLAESPLTHHRQWGILIPPVLVEDLLELEPASQVDNIGLELGPVRPFPNSKGCGGGGCDGSVGLGRSGSLVDYSPRDSSHGSVGWLSLQEKSMRILVR